MNLVNNTALTKRDIKYYIYKNIFKNQCLYKSIDINLKKLCLINLKFQKSKFFKTT